MNQAAARFFHPCNLLTYLSVLAGLFAVFAAQQMQSWAAAGGLIAVCALADTFDGKFASLFSRSESHKKFGSQFDSLADALCFGLVPVVCLFHLLTFESLIEYIIWCVLAFFYVVSALTRLGVYNLSADERGGFVGLPTTMAALIWSAAFLAQPTVEMSMFLLLVIGIGMVSPIRISRPQVPGMVALLASLILLIGLHGVRI